MTIKQIAKTGLMPENALRQLLKEGKLPVVYIGKKALINYSKLCELLNRLGDTEWPMRNLGKGGKGMRTQYANLPSLLKKEGLFYMKKMHLKNV